MGLHRWREIVPADATGGRGENHARQDTEKKQANQNVSLNPS